MASSSWQYRLSLRPGTYRVSVTRSDDGAVTVSVVAGRKVVVNFPDTSD
jgi:hypothetical protein